MNKFDFELSESSCEIRNKSPLLLKISIILIKFFHWIHEKLNYFVILLFTEFFFFSFFTTRFIFRGNIIIL